MDSKPIDASVFNIAVVFDNLEQQSFVNTFPTELI